MRTASYISLKLQNGMFTVKKSDISTDEPELERVCKYCELAKKLSDPDTMLCKKRGVVSSGYVCRAFRYDPLKREPLRRLREITFEFVDI